MPVTIKEFQGEYRWLSNFWIEKDGASVENFYQASKTDNAQDKAILMAATPGQAKKLGHRVEIREGWDDMKMAIMTLLVLDKFNRDPELRQKLIDTGDAHIQEGNTWGDTYWGVDLKTGEGKNILGQILMHVREEIQKDAP